MKIITQMTEVCIKRLTLFLLFIQIDTATTRCFDMVMLPVPRELSCNLFSK